MSNLSANTQRVYEVGDSNNVPIKASTEIWMGSAVGMTSGYARMLAAGDVFVGFADEHQNNTSATDGAKTINVRTRGLIQLTISSIAVTDIGSDVYASDGNTFTLTAGGNSFIGKVHRYVTTNTCIVAFDVTNS